MRLECTRFEYLTGDVAYCARRVAEIWTALIGSNDEAYSGDVKAILDGHKPIMITLPAQGWEWFEDRSLAGPFSNPLVRRASIGCLKFSPSQVGMARTIRQALERSSASQIEIAFVPLQAA